MLYFLTLSSILSKIKIQYKLLKAVYITYKKLSTVANLNFCVTFFIILIKKSAENFKFVLLNKMIDFELLSEVQSIFIIHVIISKKFCAENSRRFFYTKH